jgi:hypothetical protein
MAISVESSDSHQPAGHHVVDWQLSNSDSKQRQSDAHGVRHRIRNLEAQAIALSRLAAASPDADSLRGLLVALDREIAGLRAELAWRRADSRVT